MKYLFDNKAVKYLSIFIIAMLVIALTHGIILVFAFFIIVLYLIFRIPIFLLQLLGRDVKKILHHKKNKDSKTLFNIELTGREYDKLPRQTKQFVNNKSYVAITDSYGAPVLYPVTGGK